MILPAEIQALHGWDALEPQTKRGILVLAHDMSYPDLEHAECWLQHHLRLKYRVKRLKLASQTQVQKTLVVWAIKAPAQECFRGPRGTAALWEQDVGGI